ncbi:protein kinase domain-containing protein [Archangium sp.]|uniref:protein kinase domain-containing protein n=1 Tax=Archangium sp. TaxID=1872627 RepID=UPI002D22003C|nr:hypothetical protein [Archangium sp.]HYO55323.1 hypothetical protein [Archangium sp.]
MSTSRFEPLSVQPADEVAGWRVLRLWRRDAFSIIWVVERVGERRLLRMALHPPGSPEGPRMERFLEREVGALQRVRHPCIPRLHEDGRWPDPVHGFRYLLMDHVEGVDLMVARRRGITARRVVTIFSQLARAIDAMRREGVNHGSIRTENILLRADDQPMLVDFSLADWPGNPFPPGAYPLAGYGRLDEPFQLIPIIPGKRFLS